MASLTETFEMIKQAEYEAKLETIAEAWANDEVRQEMLSEALDLIKVAQEQGEVPDMDPAQILDLGVSMVEEEVADLYSDDEDYEEVEKLAEEDLHDLGFLAGQVLAENGIDEDDLSKLAEEDAEELGRAVAHEVAELLVEEHEMEKEAAKKKKGKPGMFARMGKAYGKLSTGKKVGLGLAGAAAAGGLGYMAYKKYKARKAAQQAAQQA